MHERVWRLGAAPFGFKGAVFSYAQPLRWADTISASGAFKTSICSSEGRRASPTLTTTAVIPNPPVRGVRLFDPYGG